ncbi:MAG: type I-B CRISPR-associated protein Cas7/Cst2/DevR [Gemmatimonadaceae bacterium]
MNLFATVLTYPAPSANYRGESELNRAVIQKVTDGRFDYPIISPEAMRNALREILGHYGLPMNRQRLHDEEQLAVKFRDYPDPGHYADDFLFGYLVAASGSDRKRITGELKKAGRGDFTFKRDSVLRMNLAKGLEPYRHNAVFTQSPLSVEGSAYRNATTSALLHRETAVTAFQYPFALNLNDCRTHPDWAIALLRAVGELNGVAGNHARSYFEMAPASIVVRLTEQLVAGYNTYGFQIERMPGAQEDAHCLPEIVDELLREDSILPGREFYLGGKIVRQMADKTRAKLESAGAKLDRDPRRLLRTVAEEGLGAA